LRAFIPHYQLVTPSSLAEALAMLANEPKKWKAFAGGTDLMVLLEAGRLAHQNFINVFQLEELRGIQITGEHVTLGALTTFTEVQANATLQNEFPMLCQAASETGGLAIQNRGTLGGNIVNGSPAADSPPALLAYDAHIELTSKYERRWVEYKSFHTGYKEMTMRPDELLTRIRLPRSTANATHYYRKVGTRKAQAISKICMAAVALIEAEVIRDVRIALGSVAPVPLRCLQTENTLRGNQLNDDLASAARATLIREITPIDDIRSTAAYRSRVSGNLIIDFLATLKANNQV
jgi:CO/xanthine dehydrogenase FAD-binding subunit